MKLTISNHLLLTDSPSDFCRDIRSRLTLPNPAFIDAKKMGRWTGNLERELCFYREHNGALVVPRGFSGQLVNLAKRVGIPYQIEDNRRSLPEVEFQFAGTLKPFQVEATTAMLKKDFGTLSSPTGSGKTCMALYLIAARKQPTLIIVHTKELMHQWCERIEQFLSIPRAEIGQIGGGKNRIGDKITIGIINSIYPIAESIKDYFGHIVIDECHRVPGRTFTEGVSAFGSRYMVGLSATPWRRDKLSRLIFWHVGDVLHEVKADVLVDNGDILSAEVITRQTNFETELDASEEYSKVLSELTQDTGRNRLITDDIVMEANHGKGVCLVLSDRKSHCEALKAMLSDSGIEADMLTGETGNKERMATVERLNSGNVKVLVATGQLIGEGFDAKALQTLFLTTPIKFDGRLTQYLGRVLRPAPGKGRPKVYDYVDAHVGVLAASAQARAYVYREMSQV